MVVASIFGEKIAASWWAVATIVRTYWRWEDSGKSFISPLSGFSLLSETFRLPRSGFSWFAGSPVMVFSVVSVCFCSFSFFTQPFENLRSHMKISGFPRYGFLGRLVFVLCFSFSSCSNLKIYASI